MQTASQTISIEDVLKTSFGLEQFRPKQAEVIQHILNGHHTLALLPTGYGKSLCYQVPSQVLPGVTIVVSPLIALMQDQVDGLIRRGISNVTLLNSNLESDERDDRMAAIRAGAYKLIYVAPERFESVRFQQLLASIEVSLLVIDEAHCISQWGHDFRPNYRNLSEHFAHVPGAAILALTATATPAVQSDIIRSLKLESVHTVVGTFDRPNLRLDVWPCKSNYDKDDYITRALARERVPSIVYTSSRKEAEALASRLQSRGVKAGFYHAGLPADSRTRVQRAFVADELEVIVCTVAFGMGVDKSNVRRVIHYNIPGSLESYYQEAGRAGRDGAPATCTLLFQSKDIFTQKWLIDRNYPDASTVDDIFLYIKRCAPQAVRRYDIADNVSAEDSVINSTVDLLRSLGLVATNGSGFVTITEKGRECVRVPIALLLERKQRDAARLQRMIAYAESRHCRRISIADYFGQRFERAKCDACDNCTPSLDAPVYINDPAFDVTPRVASKRAMRANAPAMAKTTSSQTVRGGHDNSIETAILQLVQEMRGLCGRTTIAQILSGSRSKKLAEKGFNKSAFYAKFASFGEAQILAMVDEIIARGEIAVSSGLYPKVRITESGAARI